MNRNGKPPHPLDRVLGELRNLWGDAAHIMIIEDDDGSYIVTVSCQQPGYGWVRVATRMVMA